MLFISPITEKLIDLALQEDLSSTDFTSDAIFKGHEQSQAFLIAKEEIVLCGSLIFSLVMQKVEALSLGADKELCIKFLAKDGDLLAKSTVFAEISGSTATILKAERVALNFIQQLSGVATHTRRIVDALGAEVKLCNTRKTLPAMRELQHYATRIGGGRSHRFNLGGGVLIKDNHISAAGSIQKAVDAVRQYAPHTLRIEVECENIQMVQEALDARADIIMLDNMSLDQMQAALKLINHRCITEASGNVTLERAKSLGKTSLDFVSCGAITHSSPAADISLRFR